MRVAGDIVCWPWMNYLWVSYKKCIIVIRTIRPAGLFRKVHRVHRSANGNVYLSDERNDTAACA